MKQEQTDYAQSFSPSGERLFFCASKMFLSTSFSNKGYSG